METEIIEISNYQKLCIFVNWSLKALGLAFLVCCYATYKGYPTIFKSIENAQVSSKLDDLAYAMYAAQEDILELHKKGKK